jgi:hypothetical protein
MGTIGCVSHGGPSGYEYNYQNEIIYITKVSVNPVTKKENGRVCYWVGWDGVERNSETSNPFFSGLFRLPVLITNIPSGDDPFAWKPDIQIVTNILGQYFKGNEKAVEHFASMRGFLSATNEDSLTNEYDALLLKIATTYMSYNDRKIQLNSELKSKQPAKF